MGIDIPTAEYETERHVFDMCSWINGKLAAMEGLHDFEQVYFERRGMNVKKLIEEAVPLCCLGLYFLKPAGDVCIRCLAGNQKYDGELCLKGFRSLRIKVEVTRVETDESTMRRQALSRRGSVYMMGPVRRDGRNIVSDPQLVDLDGERRKWVDLAFERYRAKIEKGYDVETAILVGFSSFVHLPLKYRAELVYRTEEHLLKERPEIYGVYYAYEDDFVVDGAYEQGHFGFAASRFGRAG